MAEANNIVRAEAIRPGPPLPLGDRTERSLAASLAAAVVPATLRSRGRCADTTAAVRRAAVLNLINRLDSGRAAHQSCLYPTQGIVTLRE